MYLRHLPVKAYVQVNIKAEETGEKRGGGGVRGGGGRGCLRKNQGI